MIKKMMGLGKARHRHGFRMLAQRSRLPEPIAPLPGRDREQDRPSARSRLRRRLPGWSGVVIAFVILAAAFVTVTLALAAGPGCDDDVKDSPEVAAVHPQAARVIASSRRTGGRGSSPRRGPASEACRQERGRRRQDRDRPRRGRAGRGHRAMRGGRARDHGVHADGARRRGGTRVVSSVDLEECPTRLGKATDPAAQGVLRARRATTTTNRGAR